MRTCKVILHICIYVFAYINILKYCEKSRPSFLLMKIARMTMQRTRLVTKKYKNLICLLFFLILHLLRCQNSVSVFAKFGVIIYTSWFGALLLGHWYEIMALYYVKSILTEISASRRDRRVLQKSKIIRIEFLSKWGMLQTSRYV